MSKRILIIAGEASGDKHAAEVVKALSAMSPGIVIEGIAGSLMRQAGVTSLLNAEKIAVMGFIEVLKHFRIIYKAYQIIKASLKTNRPDLVVLVDYPGFNLKIAQLAKSLNIPVLYYISPQVWAWKKGRIKKIKECVDHMVVTFPFEVELYKKAGIPVTFAGSPLLEELPTEGSQVESREKFQWAKDEKVVGVLPGSRVIEIQRILPVMLKAVQRLHAKHPELQFVLPVANTLTHDYMRSFNVDNLPIHFVDDFYAAITVSNAVMSTSGTATLETALLGVPLLVIYKMNPLTFQIIRRLIKIDKIGLCNIVAEAIVAKELIQHQATAETIDAEMERLLYDEAYHQERKQQLSQLRGKLESQHQASQKVAALCVEMMNGSRGQAAG
jgi:lipid-A-disaccharide synthase